MASTILRSRPANGHAAFIPQIRKLVFECCDRWPSSENTRTYLFTNLPKLAANNPHVEIVVRQRIHREPIIRGFYVNNRDKVIPLNGLSLPEITQKISLLLDASGAKIKPLKRKNVVSTTEAARGFWSGLHADRPVL
ncbi:hypothetical protein DXG01_012480 [Tephrocybe rancida]|nr:hypothetical protein DXG01_012480 [Tephrocybe rancida]